eukprot:4352016-Alexandrium_andersonii.AAC.1
MCKVAVVRGLMLVGVPWLAGSVLLRGRGVVVDVGVLLGGAIAIVRGGRRLVAEEGLSVRTQAPPEQLADGG